MARLALEPKSYVGLVREVGELGELEDPDPGNCLTALRVLVDPRDLGIVLSADDLVAAQASLDRRKPGVLRAPRVGVAVLARDLERAGMDHVVEENRLARRPRVRYQRLRHRRLERRRGDRAHVRDHVTD